MNDDVKICSSTVLPVEMWRMILFQINEPADLMSISKCSMFFRELLLKSRVYFLAPKVFEIILLKTTGKELEVCEGKTNNVRLEKYLIKSDANMKEDILNCRLVCTEWNKAVESCYERPLLTGNTFISNLILKSGFNKPYVWNMQRFCFYFEPEKASQFLTSFETRHFILQRNPFLGRIVHFEITLDPVNEEVDFVIAIEEILRMFGRHIWYAYLLITSKRSTINAYDYWKVNNYIRYLPNLRFLYLRFNTFKARNLTSKIIEQHPLPKLEQLVVLEVCDLDGPILEELVSKNNHVVYFGITAPQCSKENIGDLFRDLQGISVISSGQSDYPIVNWIGSGKNLKVLKLQQRCADFQMSFNFLHFKNNFLESLRDLTLELRFPINQRQLYDDCKNYRLELPHLRRLAVQFSGIHSLDFVQLLKNLEVLELLLVPKEHTENYKAYQRVIASEQIIEFVGYEQKMNDSNIWIVLEKLRNLKVFFGDTSRCFDYTRLL